MAQITDEEIKLAGPNDFTLSKATIDDLPRIVEGLYISFPQEFWDRKEPPALRPPTDSIRQTRFIKRLVPAFSHPTCNWLIVRHTPSHQIVGCACWISPGNPIHELFRKDAVDFYGWRQYFGSDAEFEELWAHVDDEAWSGHFAKTDQVREEVMGDEEHWFLASLFTWPEWQGKGVGKMLLNWAIEQADREVPPTPMYLESSVVGRPVYMRRGFVPVGESNMVRRGPVVGRKEGGAGDAKGGEAT